MTDDDPIVPATHELLRPDQALTDAIFDAAHMAVLRGEITVAEFQTAHGDEAGARLAQEMGEVGR